VTSKEDVVGTLSVWGGAERSYPAGMSVVSIQKITLSNNTSLLCCCFYYCTYGLCLPRPLQ